MFELTKQEGSTKKLADDEEEAKPISRQGTPNQNQPIHPCLDVNDAGNSIPSQGKQHYT